MKAVVATKDKNVEIVKKELRPIKHGEAKVKMEYCDICHTDLHVKNADFGDVAGVTLGHEGKGIVTEIGEGVIGLKEGDRVSIAWMFESCGRCEYCLTGRETLR